MKIRLRLVRKETPTERFHFSHQSESSVKTDSPSNDWAPSARTLPAHFRKLRTTTTTLQKFTITSRKVSVKSYRKINLAYTNLNILGIQIPPKKAKQGVPQGDVLSLLQHVSSLCRMQTNTQYTILATGRDILKLSSEWIVLSNDALKLWTREVTTSLAISIDNTPISGKNS